MKQLAVAMHNYNDTYKSLPPPAVYSQEGTPLLSWRVLILPYLEQGDLYKQFKLDEPWDSPHNLTLLPKMPGFFKPIYGQPTVEPHHTYFQVFVGPGAAFEHNKKIKIPDDFPDGTSNTLLLAQGEQAVPWTKPGDLAYDPNGPLPRLALIGPESYGVTTVDTGIFSLGNNISEKTLRAAITRNGKEELGADWPR